jgi:hypothetical protein
MLHHLQQLLASIYDTPRDADVRDFLFTQRSGLPRARRDVAQDEEVIVIEDDDGATIGVYVDEAVLARLAAHSPLHALDGSNVADLWTALEGVSHFAYLAFNLGHDRPVSRLELELQAEIDKYVATFWLLRTQHPRHVPRELHPLLFQRARVLPGLDATAQRLYRRANRYAARFCARLSGELASDRGITRAGALSSLRRLYRETGARKLRMIEAIAPA